MIKSIIVKGLNGHLNLDVTVNHDLNIVTGCNGAGKTTLLKLLWYMMSSNRELILSEVQFSYVLLKTDAYEFSIENDFGGKNSINSQARFRYKEYDTMYSVDKKISHDRGMTSEEDSEVLRELNRRADVRDDETIFFPTFRRIEGGFALERRSRMSYGHSVARNLNDAVEEYSSAMSSRRHKFVASISTSDIEELLMRKYADVSEKTNSLYLDFSRFIMTQMEQESEDETITAIKIRDSIRKRLAIVNENREKLMRPFDVLTELMQSVFKDKGVKVSQNIAFGLAKKAIAARILSAGEKQMFGFLSYNAFADKATIFIDEPELSLHVDWQRILFRMLMRQGSTNQFIIATHSPFIYSQYPQKELFLNIDRGYNNIGI